METVLLKSFTFLAIVAFGYILKRRGFLTPTDKLFLSKVVSKITLPCLVLGSVTTIYFDPVSLSMLFICIIVDLTVAFIAKYQFRHHSPEYRASAMINASGYNVANISIPFAAAFLPPLGLSYTCMFDIGNSIGWLGLSVALANNEATGEAKFSVVRLVKTLSKSIPFLVYMLIMVMGIFKLTLPSPILSVVQTIGSANTFLVMLMIGMTLELSVSKEDFKDVFTIIGIRLITSILFMVIVVMILPLPMIAKQALLLCLVPSSPSISIVFSQEVGDNRSVPAIVNSIALILGIIVSTIVLLVF